MVHLNIKNPRFNEISIILRCVRITQITQILFRLELFVFYF
jgi:hypothetical protein